MISLVMKVFKKVKVDKMYDVTIMQTPYFGQEKGYHQVYRLKIRACTHQSALEKVYRIFNVKDLIPLDYHARFITTGDIILIDEGIGGNTYYKLKVGGWEKINRVYVR